jgi:hypothetical protein
MGVTGRSAWSAGAETTGGWTASRSLGLLAIGMAAACGIGLAVLTAYNQTPGLPAEVPWPIVFGAILVMPALIGGLGAVSGRTSLLVAAGILCLVLSVLSFSGVTLVLLVPGVLFLRAAGAKSGGVRSRAEPARALGWLALAALAVLFALASVPFTGVFGLVGLVSLGALLLALLRRGNASVGPRDVLITLATIGLVLGALFTAFANTETICWNARSTAAGLVYERIPATNDFGPLGLETGVVGSGCAGGQPTIEGAALTGILLTGAIAIAVQAARGRERQAT